MTPYWHESEDAKRGQAARDAADAIHTDLPPHPLMPMILGPENTPPRAPAAPLERVRAHFETVAATVEVATSPATPLAGEQPCCYPWCGIDGKTCLSPACIARELRRAR